MPLRVIVADANEKKETSTEIMFFDSRLNSISKEIIPLGITEVDNQSIINYFNMIEENLVITSTTPDNEPLKKQKTFWIFEFLEKPKLLLLEYLHSYQSFAIRYLYNKKRITMTDIMQRKKDLLSSLIKKQVDIDIITMISGSRYEKRDLTGTLVYTKDKDDAKYKVKFTKKIGFNADNMRLLRKVFEMSDNDKSIIVHEKFVTGLGSRESIYKKVTFLGHQKWSLNIGNRNTIRFAYGKYYLDDMSTVTWDNLPKNFMLKKFEKHFNEIVALLCNQKHGALLIISDRAKQEVERLSELDRGYAISPINLKEHRNAQLITNLSNVDGAVFVDTNLVCYGTGIILDGIAKSVGSNARGSRYNSSRCYLDNKTDGNYVAIIFSEDETVDILSNIDI